MDFHTVHEPSLLREKPEDRDGHCEGDGRVRGRPAPKDPVAQQTEFENMGQVRADAVRRMGTTCNGFVSGSDYTSDYLSLADGPGNQPGWGISGEITPRAAKQSAKVRQ